MPENQFQRAKMSMFRSSEITFKHTQYDKLNSFASGIPPFRLLKSQINIFEYEDIYLSRFLNISISF